MSLRPSPVKSEDVENHHDGNDGQRQRQNSSSYVLADSPHPILDGVPIGSGRHSIVLDHASKTGRDGANVNEADPSMRSYYPSESEFIHNAKRDRSNNNNGQVKTEAEDESDHDNDNASDDEEGQGESDADADAEAQVDIPTLDTYIPREPSYEKANAILFAQICKKLEAIWNLRYNKKRVVSKQEKIALILPDSMKEYLDGGSPYPYLRLILPDDDSARPTTGLKEAKIADTWAKAMSLSNKSRCYKKLKQYENPIVVENPNSLGNLSCVVMDVMKERGMPSDGSKLTVGEVNEWLDVLIVKDREMQYAEKSAWRKSLERAISRQGNAKKLDKYAILVGKLIDKNLSPVEHKYIVQIVNQKIRIDIGLKEIMNYMHSHANEIYNSFNSLKDVCTRLSDPDYMRLLKATLEKNSKEIMETNRKIWMEPSTFPAVMQQTISPMLSKRTMFRTFLKEIAHRHGQLDKALPKDSPAKSCLAMKHPAFACEIKMDGERDLVHIQRGIVTIQTRNGVWYSPLYSPAIGPSLRAAIAGYDVDVILDGEMIAWDREENKPIPFGSNRAVAEMVRNRRRRDGTLDKRDLGLHEHETDKNVMTLAKSKSLKDSFGSSKNMDGLPEEQYWLQYVVFDILYVGGPGAKDLISKSSHLFAKDDAIPTGSLINMDCMQRKSILYNLIRPQERVVEHIRSIVIRSDGSSMDAEDYFLGKSVEYGRTPCEFDSIYLALCDKSGTTKLDSKRACGQSHEEIEIRRSLALEQLYIETVESGGQEGLIFKDLASPYYLGKKSRSMGYWWKLKPDYDESGQASDIDLLVLGGRFASGFDKRGLVGSLILGCLDTDHHYGGDGARYMTVTKVNFNRSPEEVLEKYTGYQRADENGEMQLGKWFVSEEVPDYFSSESYQRGPDGDRNGWKPAKTDRPDIWIKPEDSFVVTVNAGEFQTSSSMQAGFSLRFPRVSKYRGEGSEDPKNPDEVADVGQLTTMFDEQEANRQDEVLFGSQGQQQTSRFLTAKQLQMSDKQNKAANSRKQTNEVKQFCIPDAGAPLSKVLEGFIFSVQPGNYCLENDAFATKEAEENGWANEAKTVKSRDDVIQFIQSHGGKCELNVHQGTDFLIGGRATDAKVSNLIKLMAETDVNGSSKREEEARALIEMGGVLKWSFVFAIVSKFLQNLDDDASGYEKSIQKDWPSLVEPRRSDFLAISPLFKQLETTEDKYGLRINEISSSLDFTRALEEVGRQQATKKGYNAAPWQRHAVNNFADCERWIFGGKAQKLWPYGEHSDPNSSMCIMYPDLFKDLGFEEEEKVKKEVLFVDESPRWEDTMKSKSLGKVAATLPLAKGLGAILTPHLHSSVTHVLCDLKRHKMLKWRPTLPLTIFSDECFGSQLHERLISLDESAVLGGQDDQDVFLVSPDWLDEKWNEE